MEKRDARLFQSAINEHESGWNIVEHEVLESRRQLRQKVSELIKLATITSIPTAEMQQHLRQSVSLFGSNLAMQLVRALQRDDSRERQAIVWLLTLLNDQETMSPLQQMSRNERLPRSIRLSASLALSGMGVTEEMRADYPRKRLYAV